MDKLTLSYKDLIKKYEKILTSTARGFETNYEFFKLGSKWKSRI